MAAGALMMSYENLDYATGTTACGLGSLARSTSLRNSLKRQREPLWIQSETEKFRLFENELKQFIILSNRSMQFLFTCFGYFYFLNCLFESIL